MGVLEGVCGENKVIVGALDWNLDGKVERGRFGNEEDRMVCQCGGRLRIMRTSFE